MVILFLWKFNLSLDEVLIFFIFDRGEEGWIYPRHFIRENNEKSNKNSHCVETLNQISM